MHGSQVTVDAETTPVTYNSTLDFQRACQQLPGLSTNDRFQQKKAGHTPLFPQSPAMYEHFLHGDGQRGVVPMHHHGNTVAHQQDVNACLVNLKAEARGQPG